MGEYSVDEETTEMSLLTYAGNQDRYAEVHITICIREQDLNNENDFRTAIVCQHPLLEVFSACKIGAVKWLLNEVLYLEARPVKLVTYCEAFGLQADKQTYVMHNCAIRNGERISHSAANVFVDPENMKNSKELPMNECQFPRLLWQPTDRYGIYQLLEEYLEVMENYQKVNFYRTLLVMGIVIASMSFEQVVEWMKGFPITCLIASEGNLGKTEAVLYCLSLLGFGPRATFTKNTDAGLWEILGRKFHSLASCFDDFVNEGGSFEKMFKQIFGGQGRVCMGKTRFIQAALIITLNQSIGANKGFGAEQNQPMTRRTLQFMYIKNADMSDMEPKRAWDNLIKSGRISGLFPELTKLGIHKDGDLDKVVLDTEAIEALTVWLMGIFRLKEIQDTPSLCQNLALALYFALQVNNLRPDVDAGR